MQSVPYDCLLSPNSEVSLLSSSISLMSVSSASSGALSIHGKYGVSNFQIEDEKTLDERVDEILCSVDGKGKFSNFACFVLGG